jgi:hypothetical protein
MASSVKEECSWWPVMVSARGHLQKANKPHFEDHVSLGLSLFSGVSERYHWDLMPRPPNLCLALPQHLALLFLLFFLPLSSHSPLSHLHRPWGSELFAELTQIGPRSRHHQTFIFLGLSVALHVT